MKRSKTERKNKQQLCTLRTKQLWLASAHMHTHLEKKEVTKILNSVCGGSRESERLFRTERMSSSSSRRDQKEPNEWSKFDHSPLLFTVFSTAAKAYHHLLYILHILILSLLWVQARTMGGGRGVGVGRGRAEWLADDGHWPTAAAISTVCSGSVAGRRQVLIY